MVITAGKEVDYSFKCPGDPESSAGGGYTVSTAMTKRSGSNFRKLSNESSISQDSSENPGIYIVSWDGPNDPANPRNWKLWKRIAITFLISLHTAAISMGPTITVSMQDIIQKHFQINNAKTAVCNAAFVWGFGFSGMILAPMSEFTIFRGRNPIYYACQFLVAVMQIPTALVDHYTAFAVFRFVGGIFAAPPLSMGGATINDLWDRPYSIYGLICWNFIAVVGTMAAPIIGAALYRYHPLSYVFWFLLAVFGFFFIIILFVPETSEHEILRRKAHRLRKSTGDKRYVSIGELKMREQSFKSLVEDIFYRPIEVIVIEPVVGLMDLHMGLVQAIMYLFTQAIPISYPATYHFTRVQASLAFMPFIIGTALAIVLYILYARLHYKEMTTSPVKVFSRTALLGALLLPVGLIIWGWLVRSDIHWVIGMIGTLIFSGGSFFLVQSYNSYLVTVFPPEVVGSALASSNIVRSIFCAFTLFGVVLFLHTSTERYIVGWGSSILALCCLIMIPLPVYLYFFGQQLRNKYNCDKKVERMTGK